MICIKKRKDSNGIYLFVLLLITLTLVVLLLFIPQQPPAKEGDLVSVYYIGTTDRGMVFDTNRESIALANNITKSTYEPLVFRLGEGKVIKGFEKAVIGMKKGERSSIIIPPQEGYGVYATTLVKTLSMDDFKRTYPAIEPDRGKRVPFTLDNGMSGSFLITGFDQYYITVDFNHELAGKTLYFDVEVVNVSRE